MSYRLEQTAEELAYLQGATILDVEEEPDALGESALTLIIRTQHPVDTGDVSGRDIRVQVWQDAEGNGPGYLALTRVKSDA